MPMFSSFYAYLFIKTRRLFFSIHIITAEILICAAKTSILTVKSAQSKV